MLYTRSKPGWTMLDAYIIDRIRREKEKREQNGSFIPLHVPRRDRPSLPRTEEDADDATRGSVVVDLHV